MTINLLLYPLIFPVLLCFTRQGQCHQLFFSSGLHIQEITGGEGPGRAMKWGIVTIPLICTGAYGSLPTLGSGE